MLFVEDLGAAPERAPVYLALFWLGLMLSRLMLGFAPRSASGARALYVSIASGLASSVVIIATRNLAIAATAMFCLGASFAPMFPVMFGLVGERFAHLSGTALGIVMAIALSGGMTLPYATGALAEAVGLRTSFLIVPASLVMLVILLAVLARQLSERSRIAAAL